MLLGKVFIKYALLINYVKSGILIFIQVIQAFSQITIF